MDRRLSRSSMNRAYSKWGWSFFGVAFVQAVIVLAFECYLFATFQIHQTDNDDTDHTIPTFLALYIFGFLYQLVLVWDALRQKNTIQVIGLVIYNIGLLIYGAVQISQIKKAIRTSSEPRDLDEPFLIAIPCVLAFGTVLLAGVAWKLYGEFAWTIYKHISADLRMKRRYLTYQVYIALLKFDFFFFLGFTIQFVVIVTQRYLVEWALTIAAIPVTILILMAAAFFCKRESFVGSIGVVILYFGGLAYFIFKMVRIYEPKTEDDYRLARKELTTFAVLTILLILLTIVNAIMCMINYNKGLKPYINKRKTHVSNDESPDNTYSEYPMASAGGKGAPLQPVQRMEID